MPIILLVWRWKLPTMTAYMKWYSRARQVHLKMSPALLVRIETSSHPEAITIILVYHWCPSWKSMMILYIRGQKKLIITVR